MTAFRHVSRINVSLWGRRVGSLVAAPQRGAFAFRYEKGFLSSGIEISPLMMPLRAEPYVFADLPRSAYCGLPPIFADSLPAYDLTGSDFPSGDPWSAHADTHQLSVNGKRRDIADEDLLAVADRFGIGTARRVLDEVRAAWRSDAG